MSRLTPAKLIAEMKNATSGGAATPTSTSGARPTPNALKEIVMPKSNRSQPVLPLDREAELTIRHMRLIAAGLSVHSDDFVRTDARVLNELADALERSLGDAA